MLSTLVVRFECGGQEAKAACFGAFRGEEELVTASRCLRSRLEEGAAHRPGNSGSRSWPNVPEISSQALVLGRRRETPLGSLPMAESSGTRHSPCSPPLGNM